MALQNAFTLTANEIFESLANMIISQEVLADNLGEHQTLVDKARVDGTLYGDTKLYYATDCLKSHDWLNDAEAPNLLALDRPDDPEVQAIKLDIFKQIRLTVDNYLTKRAFADEGTFSSFNGVMLGWIRETKRVHEGTLYNVFIGTTESNVGKQQQVVGVAAARANGSSEEEANRLEAMAIAQKLADLFVEMNDYTRDFNDYGFLRSYSDSKIKVIWNSKWQKKITKFDLPTIFNKEGLMEKFEEEKLAPRYFGRPVAAGDKGSGKVIDASGKYDNTKGVIRSRVEKDIGLGSGSATARGNAYHVFPGDELPNETEIGSGKAFEESEVYIEDSNVICKVLVKLPVIMSSFEVGTTFWNPRSLTENHYYTFGYNTLQYFKAYPFITVKAE